LNPFFFFHRTLPHHTTSARNKLHLSLRPSKPNWTPCPGGPWRWIVKDCPPLHPQRYRGKMPYARTRHPTTASDRAFDQYGEERGFAWLPWRPSPHLPVTYGRPGLIFCETEPSRCCKSWKTRRPSWAYRAPRPWPLSKGDPGAGPTRIPRSGQAGPCGQLVGPYRTGPWTSHTRCGGWVRWPVRGQSTTNAATIGHSCSFTKGSLMGVKRFAPSAGSPSLHRLHTL
jgi:hypothetical protein